MLLEKLPLDQISKRFHQPLSGSRDGLAFPMRLRQHQMTRRKFSNFEKFRHHRQIFSGDLLASSARAMRTKTKFAVVKRLPTDDVPSAGQGGKLRTAHLHPIRQLNLADLFQQHHQRLFRSMFNL